MYVHPDIDKNSPFLHKCSDIHNVVSVISQQLDECNNVNGKTNKTKFIRNIFTFICSNIWFLERNNGFKKSVLDKIKELFDYEPQLKEEMNEYYKNITGSYINEHTAINNTTTQIDNNTIQPLTVKSPDDIKEIDITTNMKKVDNFQEIGFSNENKQISFLKTPLNIQNKLTIDFKDNSGTIYQGETNDGVRNGYGKYWNNTFSYKGTWKNDLPNGNGIYTFNKNKKYIFDNEVISYEGEWVAGLKEGNNCKEVYANGEYYVGQFKNNMINGIGKIYYPTGKVKYDSDQWINGIPFTDKYYEIEIHKQKTYLPIVDNKQLGYCRILSQQIDILYGLPASIVEIEINDNDFTGNFKLFVNQNFLQCRGSVVKGFYNGYVEKYSFSGNRVEKGGIYSKGILLNGFEYYLNYAYDGEYTQQKYYTTTTYLYVIKEISTSYGGKGKLYKKENGIDLIYDGIFKDGIIFRGIIYDIDGNIDEDSRTKVKKI